MNPFLIHNGKNEVEKIITLINIKINEKDTNILSHQRFE